MEIFSTILNVPIAQLFAVGLLIVILQRAGIDVVGLIKFLFGKKNGNGGSKITEQLNEIEGNHLEHIQSGIDDIKEISSESLYILKDIKEALKK